MAWAALNRELRELLYGFACADFEASSALLERAHLFQLRADVIYTTAGSPSAADDHSLSRSLTLVGERFAVLDAQLWQASAEEASHVQLIDAACVVLFSCLRLFSAGQRAAVQPLLESLQLVLHSGAIALKAVTRAAAGKRSLQPGLCQWLEHQASAIGALLRLTAFLPSGVSPTAALESAAPPTLVLSWLAAACEVLEALTPPGAKAGKGGGVWGALVGVVAGLASLPAAALHLQALQGDEQLCGRLLQLLNLPHSVAAMAVALQLPPDRRPPAFSWSVAAMVASFVAMTPPTPSMREQLGEQLDEGRLLLAAAQLLQLVPYGGSSTGPDSPGMPVEGGYWCAAYLAEQLGWAATILQSGEVPATRESCRLARVLLAVLPKLGCLLHATATASPAEVPWAELQALFTAALGPLLFVLSLMRAIETAGFPAQVVSTADVEGWCTGAAAALRWLSPLSTSLEHAAQQAVALDSGRPFAPSAVTLANLVGTWAESMARSQLRPVNLEAAAPAVWQLHTTACRLVHFLPSTSQLPRLGSVCMRHGMLGPLLRSATLMTQLRQRLEPNGAQQPDRLVQAMCLAHWEALQLLLGSGDELASQGLSGTDVVGELAHLVLHGPPALAASGALHGMLSRVVAQLPEGDAVKVCMDSGMFENAGRSLHLAVALLTSGLLPAALVDLQQSKEGRGVREAMEAIVTLSTNLVEACSAIQHDSLAQVARALGNKGAVQQRRQRELHATLTERLPAWQQLAELLLAWWRRPEAQQAQQLELAQAAAIRSCACLGCANLGGEGGPAAGQGMGTMRCSGCRAVWYCGTACSHADWRAGHKRVCKALGAARQADKERRRVAHAAGQQEGAGS